jgi:hypothetical protein
MALASCPAFQGSSLACAGCARSSAARGAVAGGRQLGVRAVGVLAGGGLAPAAVRGVQVVTRPLRSPCRPARSGRRGQCAQVPEIRAAVRSWVAPGSGPETHTISPSGGDDLQVHAVTAVLAGVEGPVSGDPVDGD